MKTKIIAAILITIGLSSAGFFIFLGFKSMANLNRYVTVRGLAEKEVKADKVTWPLYFKEVGNDLSTLYQTINRKNKAITEFLKAKGIPESEISVSAPLLIDMQAERYQSTPSTYHYNITSVITVSSDQVDLVRKLISEQSELLKQDIALSSGDYMYTINYEYTNLNKLKPSMVEEATKDARATAEKFAKDSESNLGKIKHASQGLFSIEDRDPNTPYIKKIRVVTSVDYFLKS
ncbi:MAG: SIMPL domain-containing protein [Bacteroidales bacterium]